MEVTVQISRSKQPRKVSWFEFLLSNSLIELHLGEEYPDPSPTELIALFLYQKDAAVAAAKEIKSDPLSIDTPSLSENKKIRALKLLALKVAAFLKWDLDVLNKSVPLAMVQDMLLELLKCTLGEEDADPSRHSGLDFKTLPDQALFAVQLYHRWCLKVTVDETFPSRPTKTLGVQVPGLDIPVLNAANGKDTVMAIIKEGLQESISTLEKVLLHVTGLKIPSVTSLGHVSLESDVPSYDWALGTDVTSDEIISQVTYELGRVYFLNQKFQDADKMFQAAKLAMNQIQEPFFKKLENTKLSGYCMACASISSQSPEETLFHKVEATRQNKYKGLLELLASDNQKCELGLVYRRALEEDIRKTQRGSTLCTEIMMCNAVAGAIQGKSLTAEQEHELQVKSDAVTCFLQQATSSLTGLSTVQKLQLKTCIRYLCYKLGPGFCKKVIGSKVIKIFNPDDITEVKLLIQQQPKAAQLALPEFHSGEQAEQERKLLTSYDAKEIKELVQKLLNKVPKQQIMFLTDKWKLPRELSLLIDGVAIQWVQVYSHVLIAKSRVCMNLQNYSTARALLQAADSATKDIAYKLGKHLRWELVRVDLLAEEQNGNNQSGPSDALKKSARICIASLDSKHDIHPHPDTVSMAVAYMFNKKEYDYFTSLDKVNNEYVKLCRLLAAVCTTFPLVSGDSNFPQLANCRKAARELWEYVVQQVFMTSTQTKRSASGSSTIINREGTLSVAAFIQFIKKIKDSVALSALLSCTVKVYTMLKSDVHIEMFYEYSILWPSALNNSSNVTVTGVCDAVAAIIQHALELQPNNVSWLRTKADLCLSSNQYSQAMKYYMMVGVLSTEYFTDSLNRNFFDDQILKKMIKCCNSLQCHTQVAVLCQCLEEIDYNTAFKALQETTTQDAMDGYYEYMWDSTMLEFIINLHSKRGENAKKNLAIKTIGQLELNISNPTEILFEAAKTRKANFFRALARLYL